MHPGVFHQKENERRKFPFCKCQNKNPFPLCGKRKRKRSRYPFFPAACAFACPFALCPPKPCRRKRNLVFLFPSKFPSVCQRMRPSRIEREKRKLEKKKTIAGLRRCNTPSETKRKEKSYEKRKLIKRQNRPPINPFALSQRPINRDRPA
ncbi:hypothetical protein B0T22DRAFT_126032 [Podospora appendiculata]|uniref:Uncharacterized protein n=1 Tax=Podospora appendiculata TaxID=314037 RepID=A0AAE0X7L9_9PEZI|nr:hypothetical protein B0T22DRAFT_126032 [Podospora appendiculata]